MHWTRHNHAPIGIQRRQPRLTKSEIQKSSFNTSRPSAPLDRAQSRTDLVSNTSSSNTNEQNEDISTDQEKKSISFTPSFISSSISKPLEPLEDSKDSDNISESVLAENTIIIPSPSPKKKRKNSKGHLGPLTRHFANLMNTRASDAARLHNPAFRQKAAFDLNDPRKRAKSYTDVTILGECSGPLMNTSEETKFTVLGYIHGHFDQEQMHAKLESILVWISFTIGTARSIELRKGLQLRVYDAIVLPSRHCIDIEVNASIRVKNNECRHVLICTNLCEPFTDAMSQNDTLKNH